ncbi:MAG: ABC transporter ATP-binding protein [Acidimicrobiales bacterium]
MSHAVEVASLRVAFAGVVAVDDAHLVVDFGEVVTLLGPNGAGKTTLVETLLGFRSPDAGTVRVHGLDPMRDHAEVTVRTGALLQRGGVWAPMTPRQVIDLTASYYEAPRDSAELISLLDLGRCAQTPWRRLSGGEQQRTLLALALVGRPKVLVLDEPTTGVDAEGRAVVREILDAERGRGAALLITTHELAEAERVADRVVVLSRARVVAAGSLDELAGDPVMVVEASSAVDPAGLAARLGCVVVAESPRRLRCAVLSTPELVSAVTDYLSSHGASLVSLRTRATLEERYLELVAGAAEAS